MSKKNKQNQSAADVAKQEVHPESEKNAMENVTKPGNNNAVPNKKA